MKLLYFCTPSPNDVIFSVSDVTHVRSIYIKERNSTPAKKMS